MNKLFSPAVLKPKQHTIRFTVVSIFILATVITATIAISLQYHFSKSMATESARQLFSITSDKTQEHLRGLDKRAQNITRLFAKFGDLIDGNTIKESAIPVFSEMLKSSQAFYAVYIGFGNGDFYELINLEASPVIRDQIQASFTDRWVIVEVNGKSNQRKRTFKYLGEDLTVRTQREEISDYDASARPWYLNAKLAEVTKSAPYMFQHLQAPGQTYSIKIPETNAVLAVDIALSSYTQYFQNQEKLANNLAGKEVYLFQKSGEIIASNQKSTRDEDTFQVNKLALSAKQQRLVANTAPLMVSNELDWAPIDFSISGKPQGYSIDTLDLISQMTGLTFEYSNGFSWRALVENFENQDLDVLQPVYINEFNNQRGIYSKAFVKIPFSIITQPNAKNIINLKDLAGKSLAIPQGWTIIQEINKHFPEINVVEYPTSKAVLTAVSQGEVFAGLDNDVIFRYTQARFFIEGIKYHQQVNYLPAQVNESLHFMLHKSQHELMEIIDLAITNITLEQRKILNKKWFNTDITAKKTQRGVVPYVELIELAAQEVSHGKLTKVILNDNEQFIYLTPVNNEQTEFLAIIVPTSVVFFTSEEKVKLSIFITTICLLLVLPISWLFSGPIVKPIKLLAIENEKIKHRQYGAVSLIRSNIKEVDALATSMVEMATAIQAHEVKQQQLMDSFIKLIAQTIDDKSPYTGGHCNRVPELGLMLADAAAECSSEPFKDFSFKSDDEYREFKIAAWLHDCGKIITPEHIVDKGSKLETIYNRIHEIRMRFEVLWRDAEINYYQALIKHPEQQEQLQQRLTEQQAKLSEEFAFVANANVGGEFMADEKVQKLHQIAEQTWQRHFDDTLGLSPVEEMHVKTEEVSLPATESLMTDKAEHIFQRDNNIDYEEKHGIKMPAPEHKANLGELYNLSIARGTLTPEDRYIINEHIIGTIKMLEQLPFPPELANVPKFASTHHETLIGTGYPRKLTANDLTIPERVLVIADIFEALTAADRPYKKAKPLSIAIDILHKFALDQHIDMHLFKLFLSSGTYLTYANRFMKKEQIDAVDIQKYLTT